MRTFTLTIENGMTTFLHSDITRAFEDDHTVTRRASHVEPDRAGLRLAFHALRKLFGETGAVSDWTRNWPVLWRINTAPVGGPILPTRFYDRQKAIEAEIVFLNDWFLHHE